MSFELLSEQGVYRLEVYNHYKSLGFRHSQCNTLAVMIGDTSKESLANFIQTISERRHKPRHIGSLCLKRLNELIS
jgi:hypothetical protein